MQNLKNTVFEFSSYEFGGLPENWDFQEFVPTEEQLGTFHTSYAQEKRLKHMFHKQQGSQGASCKRAAAYRERERGERQREREKEERDHNY